MKLRITNPRAQVWLAFACEYWPVPVIVAVALLLLTQALDAPY